MFNPEYKFTDFNPPIPFLTGDASVLHSIISEVNTINSLDPESIIKRQASYLYNLIFYFSKISFHFSKRLKGDISKFSESSSIYELLDLLNPVDKIYFQDFQRRAKNLKVPKHHLPVHWATTSGSTGVPLKVQCTAITKAINLALTPWTHLASGTDFLWKMASVKPTNFSSLGDSWDPASSLLFNVGPLLSVSSSEDIFNQLDRLEEYQPDFLIVFPSVLKEYVGIWGKGVRKPIRMRMVRTMGETLCEGISDSVKELTGAMVLDTYSSSEVGRIATQISPDSPYVINNYSLIVEILREDGGRCLPGEIGRVVITDLFNYATPLIRYDIGDYAIPYDEHHHKLIKVKGRSRNMITLPDGRKVWPLVGYREFSEVVPIRQFHIVQISPNSLRAKFFVDSLPCNDAKESIKGIIRESLGYCFEIEDIYQTEPLAKGANGKMEDFVSLI